MQGLGTGTVVLGIHIAAPGLAIVPGSPLDQLGRQRLSTVYMPGYKITMLPDEVVQIYTLDEGRANPAVSLYVSIDEATLEITGTETKLERVPVAVNLRHDRLDHIVTEEWLQDPSVEVEGTPAALQERRAELSFLHRLARKLKAQREVVRGKPETFNRPDYNFRLAGVPEGGEPTGAETVSITTRRRGAPLDLIVAEAAIVANSTWGGLLADHGVPGIYRSQASLAPGMKVRMGTKALPHAGIGVKSYAWATSPLRRYVDLVNQWQIIACVRHGKTAALAAPFKPKDADLFSIISSFDAAYGAYNGYQAGMERFWTLQYLRQNDIAEIDASVIKDGGGGSYLVRADDLPLVLPVLGAQALPRGARVRVKLGEIDDITLDVSGTVVERLDDPADPGDDAIAGEPEGDDEEAVAGPITIAVDVNEGRGNERTARGVLNAAGHAAPARIIGRRETPRPPPTLQHAADRARLLGGRARRAAVGALHRPGRLQPRLPGHAAGGDPGERQVQRAAREGPGHRAILAGRRRGRGQGPRDQPPALFRHHAGGRGFRGGAAQARRHAGAAGPVAGAVAQATGDHAPARPARPEPEHGPRAAGRSGAASC